MVITIKNKKKYDIKNKGFYSYKIDGMVFIDEYDNIFKPLVRNDVTYDKYIVDILGNVYNAKDGTRRDTIINSSGYTCVRLTLKKNATTWYSVHRIVAFTFKENPLNLPEVDHLDGNKQNNRADNLEWVTDHENKVRAVKNNLFHSGFSHYECRFSKKDMKRLWKMFINTNLTFRQIAKEFDVAPSTIREICIGKRYKIFYDKYHHLLPDPKEDPRIHLKSTKEDILYARKLFKEGNMSIKEICKKTGVQAYYIVRRSNNKYYSKLYDSIK